MSDTTLESCIRIARKDHLCNACEWLRNTVANTANKIAFDLDCTADELEALIKAENDGWKVKKGESYEYWRGIYDGEFSESKSIPEIHKICLKYDIYDW